MSVICKLCHKHSAIEHSHVIPAFVFRAIKSDSPTRFFRNPNSINQRLQDGDTLPLTCSECEQLFGAAERSFANEVFLPFHNDNRDEFVYGPWLHYFLSSLAWRTLVLDLPGFESDTLCPEAVRRTLRDICELMRGYLLGSEGVAERIDCHVVAWTQGHVASPQLAAVGPNTMIRRTVFGYTIVDPETGYSGILHNLAGFMCFLMVGNHPRDKWSGTKVTPSGGEIRQPQNVNSWLMGELLNTIVEKGKRKSELSERQREKMAKAIGRNPTAAALRYLELDKRVNSAQFWPSGE
jgi:hypothetical protein